MVAKSAFEELVLELMEGLGSQISVRRMFGGSGVYTDGVMFGLIADDVLYLKGDDTTRKAFEDERLAPFTYEGKNKPISMSYWRVPERAMDDPDEMVVWARPALDVARRAKKRKANRPVGKRPTTKGQSANLRAK